MKADLFDRIIDLDEPIIRNIVSLRYTTSLFDELTDGDPQLEDVAIAAEMRVKADIPPGQIERGMHYSTAIAYPFETEPFLSSRYGDGRYGVWYGSMERVTSICETAHHMIWQESNLEDLDEVVIRERAIYAVRCRALLIDLSEKHAAFPDLVSEDYGMTQQTGRRVRQEGHPGLLAPSARRRGGVNAVIFTARVLSAPKFKCYLTYHYDPATKTVDVEREPGKHYMTYNDS